MLRLVATALVMGPSALRKIWGTGIWMDLANSDGYLVYVYIYILICIYINMYIYMIVYVSNTNMLQSQGRAQIA